MTLDDLIEHLVELRRDVPSAGSATVVGIEDALPEYTQGEVILAFDGSHDWDLGFSGEDDDAKEG